MANKNNIFIKIAVLIVQLFCCINLINGLYEDQVGKFDWKRAFIGKIKYSSYTANKIIVATEENVLSCLQIQTGQIIWRQVLENVVGQQIQLLHVDKEIITVSGTPTSWFVRGWEIHSGINLWQWVIRPEKPALNCLWSVVNKELIHLSVVPESHIEVTLYNFETGNNRGKTAKINTPWLKIFKNCILSNQIFACISQENGEDQVNYINILDENPILQYHKVKIDTNEKLEIHNFKHKYPSALIHKGDISKIVHFRENFDVLPYDFASNVISIPNDDGFLYVQLEINLENLNKLVRIKTKDIANNIDKTYDIEYPRGLGAPYISCGQCKENKCVLLLSTTDHALIILNLPEGNIQWIREEALANIVSVEFFELPVSDLDVEIESEFKTASGNIFNMFIHRISSQLKQLQKYIFGSTLLNSDMLVRDDFGLHKIIVLITKVGKLFALDTITGQTVWSYRLPHVIPFTNNLNENGNMLLFVQRTARYAPLPAQCSLLVKNEYTNETVLFQFDPISGYSSTGPLKLGYKVKQAMLLPYEDENYLKPFITVDVKGKVRIYPEEAKRVIKNHLSSIYMFSIENNLINGLGLTGDDEYSTQQLWSVNLAPSELVALSTRPSIERVHSQGRVLPDRSVYYKYVNPNLVALATITDDPIHRHVLSIHLLDGITGLILYSMAHKKARGPVKIVHSENWIVYSFFNERFRRTEFVALELYEGHIQSNSTAFSSHAVSQLPQVQTQNYILPAHPQSLTVTLTERGITNKFLLVALSNGAVIEIPWALLQPRFGDIPCGPEETCYPYIPEIPLHPEASINYNQTLHKVKGIAVAPARLESTSHILVYGLDLFYTRVAPSKTFDVLKEDFDHKLIILVLTGLIVASYVTKTLASRKALKQAWK